MNYQQLIKNHANVFGGIGLVALTLLVTSPFFVWLAVYDPSGAWITGQDRGEPARMGSTLKIHLNDDDQKKFTDAPIQVRCVNGTYILKPVIDRHGGSISISDGNALGLMGGRCTLTQGAASMSVKTRGGGYQYPNHKTCLRNGWACANR